MAQSGFTPISLYHTATAAAAPTAGNLVNGELAINITDGKLYYKDNAGVVQLLASKAALTSVDSISFGTTGLTPATATTGNVVVAGTLVVGNGGTGATSFTSGGLLRGNGTSALSVASAADIVAAIGSTAVQNATNAVNATNVSGGTISNATIDDTNTVELKDTLFTLEDDVDATKKARFQLSGIATATTVTYTLPAGSGGASTLVDLGTTQTINGTKTFSGATQNLGSSTGTTTINVGYGATTSGTTKTVNIGTAGVSGSITNINIGSAVSGALGTTNITSPTLTHQGAVVLDANNFTTYADPAGTAVAMAIALG
jgi:hypothetical protein